MRGGGPAEQLAPRLQNQPTQTADSIPENRPLEKKIGEQEEFQYEWGIRWQQGAAGNF